MDFQAIYGRLIDRARNRTIEGYTESHHILPKCMGGTNDSSNLVRFTAEEHFVAHQLLVRMYPEVGKLVFALRAVHGQGWPNKQQDVWLVAAQNGHRDEQDEDWNRDV